MEIIFKLTFTVLIMLAITFLPSNISKILAQESFQGTTKEEETKKINDAKDKINENKDLFNQVKNEIEDKLSDQVCDIAKKRTAEKLDYYLKLKKNEYDVVDKIYSTLMTRKNTLNKANISTTGLDSNLKTLESMILKSKKDYNLFISNLDKANKASCALNNSDFTDHLGRAKNDHKIMLQQIRLVRKYIKTTILNDLKAVQSLGYN